MKKLKSLFILIFIVVVVLCAYNIFKIFTTGKQAFDIITTNEISANSSVEAIVGVSDKKTRKSIKSKITVEMKNSNGKKVKGFKESYEIEEGEKANISIPLPENLETGTYSLIFTSKSGLKSDSEKVNVSITDSNKSNAVISLDKGIYKPGDEVNFRALILSKTDDKPIEEEVEVSIYDANNNRVYIDKTKTSEFGIVAGKFTLADEVNSGEYKITVSTKSMKNSKTFRVNPYVTPTFEVNIETAQDKYAVGTEVPVVVKANYFFGEPVANATVEGSFGDREFSGITNAEGTFEFTQKIYNTGKYDIDLNVIDTSNYLIEASKTIYGSDNAFEIEVLPENDKLITGLDNKVFLSTKNIDGTPVKTHIEINYGTVNRQVVTDEAGIGMLEISSDDVQSLMNGQDSIDIYATDMNGNSSTYNFYPEIASYTGTIVSLEKVKYKQNEDITLTLNSVTDAKASEVMIYKNKDLLKVISTDDDRVTFNLDDTYGLIDIYTKSSYRSSDIYYPVNAVSNIDSMGIVADYFIEDSYGYTKKTIYIAPKKALNLAISTDKEEYKPGDKLTLNITSKNEDGQNVDSALLVSILDEAILSLADNDLSIDNIKLALQDIELSDGITAADLYAEILDENAENKLRVALLRQKTTNPNIIQINSSWSESYEQGEYAIKATIFGALAIMTLYIVLVNKFPKFRAFIVGIVDLLILFLVMYACFGEFLYYDMDLSQLGALGVVGIATAIIYALVLYKYCAQLFNTIINLLILPMAVILTAGIVSSGFYKESIGIAILLIPAILMTILVVVSRKIKLNKFWSKVKNIFIQCTKSEVIYLMTGIIVSMLDLEEALPVIIVALALYWVSEKIYNRNSKKVDEKVTLELTNSAVIWTVVILIVGMVLLYYYNSSTNSITNASAEISTDMAINEGFSGATASKGNLDLSVDSFIPDAIKSDVAVPENAQETTQAEAPSSNEEKVEENVRNVFLESLAFLPELVTSNGTANTTIDISDNITTWNIQTIGNTKDGRIGFNSANFKVFQDFFVDFSLPTNSVVTDKTNIPVTVYNYTDKELSVTLNVKENEWCTIGSYSNTVNVLSNSTKMVYVPIELIKSGDRTLRIEATANGVSDIVEKTFTITPNGFKKTKVVASGVAEEALHLDHFTTETAIEDTRKLKVKLYPSVISQTIEGMENIFRMPTGCFEQTSSSLYPDILALKYLEDTGLNDPEIKEKALDYISKGYQKLLTYETSDKGGYSLYGDDPAENVLTAFGLMEFTDLKEVYDIDENVINNMTEYLFRQQNINGSFEIDSTYIGSASSTDDLAMNAYIIWALSEACPEDKRLEKSVNYLEDNLDKTEDNYTIALMANVFENTKSKSAKRAINKLMEAVEEDGNGGACVNSTIRDYWGCYGTYQNIQATALTSMALTKANSNSSTNNALLKYIISHKDTYGTWSTTQGTILALKAINAANSNSNISNQKIQVKLNSNTREVEIKDNPLDLYEVVFEDVKEENKISVESKKGKLYYEITEEYYVEYDNLKEEEQKLSVTQTIDTSAKVNDTIHQNITVTNGTGDMIRNGLVAISIPQGCSVIEETLSKLEHLGIIEKYEFNYNTINLYFRNFDQNSSLSLDLEYKANYPEQITGAMVRAYDYYNPNNEGYCKPVNISIAE